MDEGSNGAASASNRAMDGAFAAAAAAKVRTSELMAQLGNSSDPRKNAGKASATAGPSSSITSAEVSHASTPDLGKRRRQNDGITKVIVEAGGPNAGSGSGQGGSVTSRSGQHGSMKAIQGVARLGGLESALHMDVNSTEEASLQSGQSSYAYSSQLAAKAPVHAFPGNDVDLGQQTAGFQGKIPASTPLYTGG